QNRQVCIKGWTSVDAVFFFQAEDGIRDGHVTGVQTCALPIYAQASTTPTPPNIQGGPTLDVRRRRRRARLRISCRLRAGTRRGEIGRASCRERVSRPGDSGGVERTSDSNIWSVE